jgi:hypothetical protein
MSIFEIIMLLCFAAGWPFSIYKSYTVRVNGGKSLPFLVIVFVGYIAGIMHKVLYNFDGVIYLYILNGAMVMIDIMLYWRNWAAAKVNRN